MQIRFRSTVVWLMVFWALVPALILSFYLFVQFRQQALALGADQLDRESKQLAVELERTLLQIQNQFIRLSEQGAVVRSATVSFLSQKAIEQMDELRAQYPMVDSIVLMDTDQFLMEVSPEASLKVDFSALEDFVNSILFQRYQVTLEAISPKFKYYFNYQLAEISQREEHAQYLVLGQPIIRTTDSLSKPYETDGVLILAINLDALVKYLAAQTNVDISSTHIALQSDRYTLYETPALNSSQLTTSTELVDYSLNAQNPTLYINLQRANAAFLSDVDYTIRNALLLLIGFIIVVFISAIFVARRLTRPLRALQKTTHLMASGQYHQVPALTKFQEFRDLSRVLSDMGDTIEQQLTQLNTAKLNLESKVHDRTIELQNSITQLSHQGALLRGLMQVTVDMQRARDVDALLDCSLIELRTQFTSHQTAIVLNRTQHIEAIERTSELTDSAQGYLKENLNAWRYQDFDFRMDYQSEKPWTLVPIRDNKRQVIGQLLFYGPDFTELERDIIFILTRLMSTMLDQRMLNLKLERLANTDALTGLANRYFFESQFSALKKKWTEHKTPVGLIIVDVDYLKQVNDQHGHKYGDQMIQKVADQLQHLSRESDVLARVGGDEFYILLQDADEEACQHAVNRLRQAEHRLSLMTDDHTELAVGYSIGYACTDTVDFNELITRADERMYIAKHENR